MLDKAAIYLYLGIFFALVAAGLGFPVPEELPIVAGGAMAGHAAGEPPVDWSAPEAVTTLAAAPDLAFPANLPWAALAHSPAIEPPPPVEPHVPLRWWIMLPLCIAGVVISDSLLYGMGRLWGPKLLDSMFMKRLVPPAKRQRIEENFHNYGVLVLLFARFLPTIRSPVFIMAGIMRVPFTRFLMADGIYAIPGVSLLFFLAFWFGDQARDLIETEVQKARPILILLGLAAVTAYLIYHFFRHPVATGDPREELPVIGGQVAAKMGPAEETPAPVERGEWAPRDGGAARQLRKPGAQASSSFPHSPDGDNAGAR